MGTPATQSAVCPECGVRLAATSGWTTWCPACDWNLTTGQGTAAEPRTRFERAYVSAGARFGRRLEAQLEASQDLEPRWTAGKIAAITIGAAVHLLTLTVGLAGLVLVVTLELPGAFIGLPLLGMAWLMWPRLGRPPKEGVIAKDKAPTLYGLATRIAESLATRPPDLIVADGDFNASWNVMGIRRRRVLTLGLPLFDGLAPQERVALIAHEIGHGRNGDVRRGLVVGSAISSLGALYELLAPGNRTAARDVDPLVALAEPITNAVMYVVTRPLVWLLLLQAHLVWRDSQRAEYLADALGARAAGTQAEISLTRRLLESRTFEVVARRMVNAGSDHSADLFADLREAFAKTPEQERLRLWRAAQLEQTRLDATHPPVTRRVELLQRRPAVNAGVGLSTADAARMDVELGLVRNAIAAQILEEYRSSLYTGAR